MPEDIRERAIAMLRKADNDYAERTLRFLHEMIARETDVHAREKKMLKQEMAEQEKKREEQHA